MAKSKRGAHPSGRREPRIMINIPGVDASTRVGDLTVSQFISLLVQISPQVPRSQARYDEREVRRLFDEIGHAIIAETKRKGAIGEAVVATQRTILRDMPAAVRRVMAAQQQAERRRRS